MRIALHSTLREGMIEGYRERHVRIPDDLRQLFDRVGIRDWVIWRSGDRLFHLVDCEDFTESMAAVSADPANDAWQAEIGRFVDVFHGPDGEVALEQLEQVWSLEGQRAGDGAP